jgi:hypothetical protein
MNPENISNKVQGILTYEMTLNKMVYTGEVGWSSKVSDLYSEDAQFESWSGHQPIVYSSTGSS